jgi:hypothetical protein
MLSINSVGGSGSIPPPQDNSKQAVTDQALFLWGSLEMNLGSLEKLNGQIEDLDGQIRALNTKYNQGGMSESDYNQAKGVLEKKLMTLQDKYSADLDQISTDKDNLEKLVEGNKGDFSSTALYYFDGGKAPLDQFVQEAKGGDFDFTNLALSTQILGDFIQEISK